MVILYSLIYIHYSFVYAGPISTTYELKEYGFGSGGNENNTSTNYSMFAVAGELDNSNAQSTNYALQAGLTFSMQTNVPAAPSFTNPSSNYDRLKFIIDNGNNPTDTTFAIAISSDAFASTTNYIQSDFTIGSSPAWLTYTGWGGASGQYVTGLASNTTYSIKVKARQGNFTESGYSVTTSVATSVPSLTFAIDSSTINFSNLNAGNSYTDNTKTTTFTTSTNAYNGYIIYGRDTAPLHATIPNFSAPNSAPTTWSTGVPGFGYTTNDSSLSGGTANRFTSGANYAGFTTTAPGDPVADHAGPVVTAISNENWIVTYRVTAASTTPAGRYSSTILYIVVPTY